MLDAPSFAEGDVATDAAGSDDDLGTTLRDAVAPMVPLLRGVMHQCALTLTVALGVVLVVLAPSGRSRLAAVVYSVGLCACLGMSALYHRGRWSSRIKRLLCTADHCAIFLLIGGTVTAMALLAVGGWFGNVLITAEWGGVLAGITVVLLWRRPPAWAEVGPYLVLGWLGLLTLPALYDHTGIVGLLLVVGGGALYTAGSVIYSLERPDPWPRVFGFHEVFHTLVTAAVSAHAVVVALLVFAA